MRINIDINININVQCPTSNIYLSLPLSLSFFSHLFPSISSCLRSPCYVLYLPFPLPLTHYVSISSFSFLFSLGLHRSTYFFLSDNFFYIMINSLFFALLVLFVPSPPSPVSILFPSPSLSSVSILFPPSPPLSRSCTVCYDMI